MSEVQTAWVVVAGIAVGTGCNVGQAVVKRIDFDSDGYVSEEYLATGASSGDCDDTDSTAHPGKEEIGASCGDGVDQDCDGEDCVGELVDTEIETDDGRWVGYSLAVVNPFSGGEAMLAVGAPGTGALVEGTEDPNARDWGSGQIWLYSLDELYRIDELYGSEKSEPQPLASISPTNPPEMLGASLASTDEGGLFVGAPQMSGNSGPSMGGVALFLDPSAGGTLGDADITFLSNNDYSYTGVNLAATTDEPDGAVWLVAAAAPADPSDDSAVQLLRFSTDGVEDLDTIAVGTPGDLARHDLLWADADGSGLPDLFTVQKAEEAEEADWQVNLYLDPVGGDDPDWHWAYLVDGSTEFGPSLAFANDELYIGMPYGGRGNLGRMPRPDDWTSTDALAGPSVTSPKGLPDAAGVEITTAWSYDENAANGDLLVFTAKADEQDSGESDVVGWRYSVDDLSTQTGTLSDVSVPAIQRSGGVVAAMLPAASGGECDRLVLGFPGVSSLDPDGTLWLGTILLGPAWQ